MLYGNQTLHLRLRASEWWLKEAEAAGTSLRIRICGVGGQLEAARLAESFASAAGIRCSPTPHLD